MSRFSRRTMIGAGLSAVAGASGLAIAGKLARQHGLIPPDSGGLYGPGETLTYGAQRLLARHSLAREFPREAISAAPWANPTDPPDDLFKRHQAAGFANWTLAVDGLVARPVSLSLAEIKSQPSRSHITMLVCEEGWSYIAEWTGVPLSHILELAGAKPEARHVVYFSQQHGWWDSLDMDEALHPQTLIAHTMNGQSLPVGHGGPLRMRVPKQLGYKNVKFVARLTVTDDIRKFSKGLGSASPEFGYSWYAGI
ncbi:MAG: molybdopterin-dependent oxidoreductase [Acidobacteria bacterium]|nr:molybdopterin-dependent oxidoreductase [Acidobacteriota bacterium]